MPYNTTAIPPRKEPTGQATLPVSRTKKTVAADEDVALCSQNAAFVLTIAAEMFVQHVVSQALNVAKGDKRPRRNIQYKDIAEAVSIHDNLEFAKDIIPKTYAFKEIKEMAAAKRAQYENRAAPGAASSSKASNKAKILSTPPAGGRAANGATAPSSGGPSAVRDEASDDANAQLQMDIQRAYGGRQDGDTRRMD